MLLLWLLHLLHSLQAVIHWVSKEWVLEQTNSEDSLTSAQHHLGVPNSTQKHRQLLVELSLSVLDFSRLDVLDVSALIVATFLLKINLHLVPNIALLIPILEANNQATCINF